jgi:nucleoside-diphosphate-sugar epimerase
VLVTGAAGAIGSAFCSAVRERYRLRLADRVEIVPSWAAVGGHETVFFDIGDLDACRRACQGMDTVVHLAADANPEADFYGSLLHNNVVGTYNVFRAAKDRRCWRVIFASSAWVYGGYPDGACLSPDAPVRPVNMYGVSKCFGESVAANFAYAEQLSSIVVRIGAYDSGAPDSWLRRTPPDLRTLSTYVSARDLHDLLIRCIEAPAVRFGIVHGVSNNRTQRLDLDETRRLVSYTPQDDGFARLGDGSLGADA